MAFQLAHSFVSRFWTLQPQTNYLENWNLKTFLITTQGMVFVFVCLLSARVKDQILWKLDTLICEKAVSFKFAIRFQHIAQPWSCLEQIGRGFIFWSIRHILAWFFGKICFAILGCHFAIVILALLFLLIGEQCLIWRIHLGYSLMVNSASYFLLLVIQFVWF